VRDLGLARRSSLHLRADGSRVVARLFVPGHELLGGSESRAESTVERVMALSEEEVDVALASLCERFSSRHENIHDSFNENFTRVAGYVKAPISMSRQELLGATFTHELTLEGAAICNPSLVASPHQDGLREGEVRVVMSYRAISEGHRSSICFRDGVIGPDGTLTLEEAEKFPVVATSSPTSISRKHVRELLHDRRAGGDSAESVLSNLFAEFSNAELEVALKNLELQSDTRPNALKTIRALRSIAAGFYAADFSEDVALSRRVLWPTAPNELEGMEDARFVRLDDGGTSRYVATYTAFDGTSVAQQFLETEDFRHFASTPLAGRAARNKGLAIFPRKIAGHYAALSRHDRESNTLAFSDDLHCWDDAITLETPQSDWELLQLGNCGSPIELPEGWLVLTHGVGPMRTYAIGALLLDLGDPSKVIARSHLPILSPNADEQDGYVPNVVYSCGSYLHGRILCLPYGVGDQSIRYATFDVDALLYALVEL